MITRPLCALSMMIEDDFRLATLPLFERGDVDAIEWSFDVGWSSVGTSPSRERLPAMPAWLDELLDFYSRHDRLLGHGVTFSPLSGAWHDRQAHWLARLHEEVQRRQYRHVSEHFGFMTAGDFHQSAPLPVPRDEHTIALGQDRLRRLAATSGRPVGLENLAFAFGPADVAEQGRFLDALLEPVDGFLLLDLHNLYCQAANFDIDGRRLLDHYPLERVRELHVSGGSWAETALQPEVGPVRRDTHDDAVPEEVFTLLRKALGRCPSLEIVTLERLGDTIADDKAARQFQRDFRRVREIVESA